jgi:hypothetical protein
MISIWFFITELFSQHYSAKDKQTGFDGKTLAEIQGPIRAQSEGVILAGWTQVLARCLCEE